MNRRVSGRARLREDRGGDPLDGLVNLFDLGIVLAVAFLLAALSSIDITPAELRKQQEQQASRASEDQIVVRRDQQARELQVKPGERAIGRGEPVGTVYRLEDGRTVLVRPKPGSDGPSGTGSDAAPGPGSDVAPAGTTMTKPPAATPGG